MKLMKYLKMNLLEKITIRHKHRTVNILRDHNTINNIIMDTKDLNQINGNKMNNPTISNIIMKIFMSEDKMVKIP